MLFRETVQESATNVTKEDMDILETALSTIEGEETTVKKLIEGYKLTIVVNVASK